MFYLTDGFFGIKENKDSGQSQFHAVTVMADVYINNIISQGLLSTGVYLKSRIPQQQR